MMRACKSTTIRHIFYVKNYKQAVSTAVSKLTTNNTKRLIVTRIAFSLKVKSSVKLFIY